MTLSSYTQRKESGLEWIGEVPEHWQIKRLRFLAHLNPSKSEINWSNNQVEVLFLPMEAIGDDGSIDRSQRKQLSDVQSGYTYFRNDDVTFAKITPCFENGKGAHLNELPTPFGFGSTELTILRAAPGVLNERFLYLVTVSELFRVAGEAAMYGAGGQKRVPDGFVRNFKMAWPSLKEQEKITTFLDHETAKIDALVAEQQRLIELLKEKRQAVISHAVTKGLDPNVPMKDSGVEWLGEIPASWRICRVKYVTEVIDQGWSPQCDAQPADLDSEQGVLKVGCVNGGRFDPRENKKLPEGIKTKTNLTIRSGDLLISRANTKELVGSAAVTNDSYPNLILCDKLYRLRLNGVECNPTFLAKFLGIDLTRYNIEIEATGASSSMQNIGQSTILELPMPLPPLAEQEQLISAVETTTEKLQEMIAEAQTAIEILTERRSALISAAVTGKIDVRDWQPPTGAGAAEQPLRFAETTA